MPGEVPEQDREELVSELLDAWENARTEGREVTPEQLCEPYPDVLQEVKRRIRALEAIDARLFGDQLGDPTGCGAGTIGIREPLTLHTELREFRLHASGGLGDVYAAHDMTLNRKVAVKFISRSQQNRPVRREQFKSEAEITSRLDHPGVVPVYGYGTADAERLFYVMRFVEGQTLHEAAEQFHKAVKEGLGGEERRSQFHQLLSHFIAVCKTVAYAHFRGLCTVISSH